MPLCRFSSDPARRIHRPEDRSLLGTMVLHSKAMVVTHEIQAERVLPAIRAPAVHSAMFGIFTLLTGYFRVESTCRAA